MTDRNAHFRRTTLLVAGFSALLVAWLVGNPLAATPDEPTHFVKAVATAYGKWTGRPLEQPQPPLTPREEFLAEVSGLFDLPTRFALPESLACVAFHPERSAACQEPARPPVGQGVFFSQVAPYPPFLYLPLGLAARAAPDPVTGLRLARVAEALVCLLLLVGAARCCRSQATALGLLLAVTPTALFLFASVTTSGTEVAGAICLAAATLALVRGQQQAETWLWWALGGVVLVLSRPLGPLWLGLLVSFSLAIASPRSWLAAARAKPVAAPVAGVVVMAATGLAIAWGQLVMPHPNVSYELARPFLAAAVADLPERFDGAVGLFGWYDTPLPEGLYVLGRVLHGLALVMALLIGSWRQRLLLGTAVLVTAALTVGIDAATQRPLGFVMQSRYTMPIGVIVPLLCGHVLAERGGRLSPRLWRFLLGGSVVGVAVLHAGAWYANAHRYAVGLSGRLLFVLSPESSPRGGWWPWLLFAVVGAALLSAGALVGCRSRLLYDRRLGAGMR